MWKIFKNKDHPLQLDGKTVYLRPPLMRDFHQWRNLRSQSASFLQKWEPKWSAQEFDHDNYKFRIKTYQQQIKKDEAYPFFIFKKNSDTLLGGINLTDVKRKSSQYANLGYWMGEPYQGQGFMSEAVENLIQFSFKILKLHRIHAACIPHNSASIAVLRKNKFIEEGYRSGFLKINDEWQDHLLFGLINKEIKV